MNETLGNGFVAQVSATYAGIYQWTVNLEVSDDGESFGESKLQLKFGPSAWFAIATGPPLGSCWMFFVRADFAHLYLTRAKLGQIRRSAVTLRDVLEGLEPHDRRLHDEIVKMWDRRST